MSDIDEIHLNVIETKHRHKQIPKLKPESCTSVSCSKFDLQTTWMQFCQDMPVYFGRYSENGLFLFSRLRERQLNKKVLASSDWKCGVHKNEGKACNLIDVK